MRFAFVVQVDEAESFRRKNKPIASDWKPAAQARDIAQPLLALRASIQRDYSFDVKNAIRSRRSAIVSVSCNPSGMIDFSDVLRSSIVSLGSANSLPAESM